MAKVKAYFFANEDRKLSFGDGRKIVVGETHSVKGKIVVCGNGLHGCPTVIEALGYAKSTILYEVELSGEMHRLCGVLAARRRKYISEIDMREILKVFARRQAMINAPKIRPYCTKEKYNIIQEYLQTGNMDLRNSAQDTSYTICEVMWSGVQTNIDRVIGSSAAAVNLATEVNYPYKIHDRNCISEDTSKLVNHVACSSYHSTSMLDKPGTHSESKARSKYHLQYTSANEMLLDMIGDTYSEMENGRYRV